MYELWMIIYVACFPVAYLGYLGLFGKTAKQAADRYFWYLGIAISLVGLIMMADVVFNVLKAYIQALLAG